MDIEKKGEEEKQEWKIWNQVTEKFYQRCDLKSQSYGLVANC